jgi:hypothetical protein
MGARIMQSNLPSRDVQSGGLRWAFMCVVVLVLLMAGPAAMATPTQVQLTFTGAGNSYGSVGVYPYNMQIGDSQTTTPMICDTFANHITQGQSWTATVYNYADLQQNLSKTMFSSLSEYQEAFWLFGQLASGASTDVAGINYAIWYLFNNSTSVPFGLQNDVFGNAQQVGWLTQAVNGAAQINKTDPGYWNQFVVYTPVCQAGQSCPQEMIAYNTSPVPEPGSLALIGTGLATLGGFLRRKKLS